MEEATYDKDLVSVVIPTYKRPKSLKNTIQSVLDQTYSNLEVLIVNDNTAGDVYSQELYKMIADIPDNRVRLVEQKYHINGAAARNAGIRVAKGEYIAFLDDDDTWEPEKIQRQVEILSNLEESWGAVACLAKVYRNGRLVKCSLPYRDGNILLDVLQRRVGLGMGSVLIRRKALDQCSYFDENLKRHQDLQLFAFLTEKYKVKLDPVYLYNIETGDAQNRPTAEKLVQIKKDYFNSISSVMDNLPKKEQQLIHALHNFEQAYAYFKERKYREVAVRIFAVIKSPKAVYLSVERSARKTIEKRFKHRLEKKYSLQGKKNDDR